MITNPNVSILLKLLSCEWKYHIWTNLTLKTSNWHAFVEHITRIIEKSIMEKIDSLSWVARSMHACQIIWIQSWTPRLWNDTRQQEPDFVWRGCLRTCLTIQSWNPLKTYHMGSPLSINILKGLIPGIWSFFLPWSFDCKIYEIFLKGIRTQEVCKQLVEV